MPEAAGDSPVITTITSQEEPATFSQLLPLGGALLLGFLVLTAVLLLLSRALKQRAARSHAANAEK